MRFAWPFSWNGADSKSRPRAGAQVRQEPVLDLVAEAVSEPESRPHQTPTPTMSGRRSAPISKGPALLTVVPARDQAERLLRWLQDDGVAGKIWASEVLEIYHDMVIELQWTEANWNTIGNHLRQLTGGRKTYDYCTDKHGIQHRLRFYQIPAILPVASDSEGPTARGGRLAEGVSARASEKRAA